MHLKIEDQQLKTIMRVCVFVCVQIDCYNQTSWFCKPKIYSRYTYTLLRVSWTVKRSSPKGNLLRVSGTVKRSNPKGNQPWIFVGRTDTEGEAPVHCPPDMNS